MRQFIDVTGKTEDEAIQNALRQLGLDRDDVSVEILERAKSGFLGLGSCPAEFKVALSGLLHALHQRREPVRRLEVGQIPGVVIGGQQVGGVVLPEIGRQQVQQALAGGRR